MERIDMNSRPVVSATSNQAATPHIGFAPSSAASQTGVAGAPRRGKLPLGLAARVLRLMKSIDRNAAEVARAALHAGADLELLTRHLSSTGVTQTRTLPPRRRPSAWFGGAILLSLAALKLLRRSRAAARAEPALTSLPPEHFAETLLPLRDRPSGYFSARGEGTLTNTEPSRTAR